MSPTDTIIKEILIHAPAERIFDALTDPQQRVRWWGVKGRFQAEYMESDLRPKGAWLMRGMGMDGKPFTLRGEYRSIERPQLLEFTLLHSWQENASPTLVRFELNEKDGSTMVRLIHSGLVTEESRRSFQGWPWLLEQLHTYIEAVPAKSETAE